MDVNRRIFFKPLSHSIKFDFDHITQLTRWSGQIRREQHHLREMFIVRIRAISAFDAELETASDDLAVGILDAGAGGELDGEVGRLHEGFHGEVDVRVEIVFPDVEGAGGAEGVADHGAVEEDSNAARGGMGFEGAVGGEAAGEGWEGSGRW